MRKTMALLATASLAVAGLAATTAPAQASPTNPNAPYLSEVLINTQEPTQANLGKIKGAEVYIRVNDTDFDTDPNNDVSLNGYEIEVCTSGGVRNSQGAFSSTAIQATYAMASPTGWTAQSSFSNMDRSSGVFLSDPSGNYIDGVLFQDANGNVSPNALQCMINAAPANTVIEQSPAPADGIAGSTPDLSAQRAASIGAFALAVPTFQQVDGARNF